MRDAEVTRCPNRTCDEIRLAVVRRLANAGRHDDDATRVQELVRRLGFELAPDPVRIQDQGNVIAAFADGLPCDAGFTVAGSHHVGRRKAIDADRLYPSLGQLIESRAAHGTEADHQNVRSDAHDLKLLNY